MLTRSKLLLAALAAVTVLSLAVGGASARNWEVIRSDRGFRITWSPLRLEAVGNTIECPVTLEGTYERSTYTKLTGTRLGLVTGATVGTCPRGRATILRETLPWEVDYTSFTGTLPNITSITISLIKASFRVETGVINCLARTEINRPARGIETVGAGGNITGFRADETAPIETGGGFFCSIGGPAHFAGAANGITSRDGSAVLNIRLI